MGTPGGGVEIDVAALRATADLLRAQTPALGAETAAAGQAVDDAAGGAGAAVLADALQALAQRWHVSVGGTAQSLADAATILRASVEAQVALDQAGARDLGGP